VFRLLVSGSREWDMPEVLQMVIIQHWFENDDLVIIHGDCPKGADRMAREFCEKNGIPEERYPADWNRHGKAAGHIRNKVMVDTKPDFAVFFIRGESRGTKNCLEHAKKAGIPHATYGDRP
jgi:hypothetical protein